MFFGKSAGRREGQNSQTLKHLMLTTSVVAAISTGATSFAQEIETITEQNDEAQSVQDVVVVTGSNVARSGFDANLPLQVVSREELLSFGVNQPSDLLRAIPSNTGSIGNSEVDPIGATGQFNLRGLGLGSTLTLVNGRRAGVSPLSDNTGNEFVDINQFPTIMIDRIEVLKDGASAIYGSEAVAGVANIVTRSGFEGLEFQADYENSSNETYSAQVAFGTAFDKGHINFFGGYYGQTGNLRTDFDWLNDRIIGGGDESRSRLLSSTGHPGSYRRATTSADGGFIGVPGSTRVADPDCLAAGGFFITNDDGSTNNSLCRHSFAEQLAVIPEEDRLQGYVEFTYELADGIRFFNESNASRNKIRAQFGPSAFAGGLVEENSAGNVYIPGDHPFNFFIADPNDATGVIYIGPDAWDPAVHQGVDLAAQMRPLGVLYNGNNPLSDNLNRTELNYFRSVNGLEFDLPNDWTARASYQFATGKVTSQRPFNIRSDVFNQLIIDGEFNPFGTAISNPELVSPKDGVSTSVNETQVIDQFNGTFLTSSETTQNVADFIVSGDLFDFGTGLVSTALGAQYRKNELRTVPDPLESAGEGRVSGLEFAQQGEQDVYALFGEAVIPFNDLAELQVALRYEDYGDGIGSTTDPKVTARISPTDWLSLRGSYGTAFQAPSLRQTSSSRSTSFFDDPTISGATGAVCDAVGRNGGAIVSVQGSDDLKPQSSDNYNVGVVVTPANGMQLSVDYWSYDYTDLIAQSESAQAILNNDCAGDGIANDPRVIRDGGGNLLQINTEFVNIGEVQTDGLDIAFSYGMNAGSLGDFVASANATYVRKFDVNDGDVSFDGAGNRNFTNNFAPIPQWRFNTSFGWLKDIHSANATVRYIGGYDNDQSNNAPIDSYITVDLQYGLDLTQLFGTEGTGLVLGVENVFDQDPPALTRLNSSGEVISGTRTDIDRPGYDPLVGADLRGRNIYMRIRQTF